MNQDPLADVRRWLAAEGHDEPAAEAAFRGVFGLLPRLVPPTAFADRVLRAALIVSPAAAQSLWGHVLLRTAVGLGLVMTGLAVLAATTALPIPQVSFVVGSWASVVAGATAWLGRVLEIGLSVWGLCGKVGDAAVLVAAAPAVTCVLAGNGVLALAAFWGLRRLLRPREEMISW
jgi:hypothetical protein